MGYNRAGTRRRARLKRAKRYEERLARKQAAAPPGEGEARPGGLVFLSTLNRTAKAWALAIAGAEYLLGWLPRGTHDWRKFLRPSEVARGLRLGGVEPQEVVGVVYSPLSRAWSLNRRMVSFPPLLTGQSSGPAVVPRTTSQSASAAAAPPSR